MKTKKHKLKKIGDVERADAFDITQATHFIASNMETGEKTPIKSYEEARKAIETGSFGRRTVIYAYQYASWNPEFVVKQIAISKRDLEVIDQLYPSFNAHVCR